MTGKTLLVLPRRAYRDRPASELRMSIDEFPAGVPLLRIQPWILNARTGEAWPDRDRQVTIRAGEMSAVADAVKRLAAREGGGR